VFFLLARVADGVSSRVQYSETNSGRIDIYTEAFERTLKSPLLGYGAPRPSLHLVISVGTQGQFWNLMFCYGFPGLAFFCFWLGLLAWRTRRAAPDPLLWLHVVPVVACTMILFYGLDQTELVVIFVAASLVFREMAAVPPAPPPADDEED
jgi:hypothetical protein